jgi:hypothetical protein
MEKVKIKIKIILITLYRKLAMTKTPEIQMTRFFKMIRLTSTKAQSGQSRPVKGIC